MRFHTIKTSVVIILIVFIGLCGVSVEESLSEIVKHRRDTYGNLWGFDCKYNYYYDDYYDCKWVLISQQRSKDNRQTHPNKNQARVPVYSYGRGTYAALPGGMAYLWSGQSWLQSALTCNDYFHYHPDAKLIGYTYLNCRLKRYKDSPEGTGCFIK